MAVAKLTNPQVGHFVLLIVVRTPVGSRLNFNRDVRTKVVGLGPDRGVGYAREHYMGSEVFMKVF